jgi:hypothetical protein
MKKIRRAFDGWDCWQNNLEKTVYNCFNFEIKDYANVYILVLTNGGYHFTKGDIKQRLANNTCCKFVLLDIFSEHQCIF